MKHCLHNIRTPYEIFRSFRMYLPCGRPECSSQTRRVGNAGISGMSGPCQSQHDGNAMFRRENRATAKWSPGSGSKTDPFGEAGKSNDH